MNHSDGIQKEPHDCTGCEETHGDQAPTADELRIAQLEAEVKRLDIEGGQTVMILHAEQDKHFITKGVLRRTVAERDGAIANLAAVTRERDHARQAVLADEVEVKRLCEEIRAEEREACAEVAAQYDFCAAAAIRARGGE